MRRHRRRQDRAPASAARSRSTSRAWPSCRAQPRAAALLDRAGAARSSTRGCCSSPSARRRPTPATPTSSAVHAVVDAMPASDRHALVMKSTVPGRHRRLDQARVRRAGQGRLPLRLLPGVPQGGLGARGLPRPRPRRRRRRRRLGRRRRRRALRAARRAARAHRHRAAPRWSSSPPTPSWPRRSRSSTRSPTSARRPAPTSSRSRAGWASTTASARSSCGRASASAARCFPKDVTALKQLAGNSGYHFQLLNAVIEVNELQKRRVIGKLQKHLGSLVGKRVALLGLAFKPNTDDMREASSLVLAARLQADGATRARLRPDRRGGGARADARRRVRRRRARRASRAPTPSCS